MPRTAALIVAAGRGLRAGAGQPKQWRPLGGRPMLHHTVAAFQVHHDIDQIILVLHPDEVDHWQPDAVIRVAGGATRQASVRAGLDACTAERVLIHDAARPFVSAQVIRDVIGALDTHVGAAPGLPVTDALWRGAQGLVSGLQNRDGLFRAQTPQGFVCHAIREAHRTAPEGLADDVAVARAAGLDVAIVPGDPDNFKITHPADFARAEHMMERRMMDVRLGNGFDVHAFCDGDHVTLCGVRVPHDRGLLGHSDADVGMHAITDAIYGALGRGDIGVHFPPSDPQWKGAESHIFLRHAAGLAREMGLRIGNVDCTLICEHPKIGPHQAAMRQALSQVLDLGVDRISVKATTSERLGFTGRGEGIAALATTTLVSA